MSFKDIESKSLDVVLSVFGTSVTYDPITGVNVTLKGIFDQSYVEVEGVVSVKPTLRIKLSDLPLKPRKGDSVTISSVIYRVLESREDSFGGSTLILNKS